MKPGDPSFPEHKEAAQDRKDDKGEVEAQDKIRQHARLHVLILQHSDTQTPLPAVSYPGLARFARYPFPSALCELVIFKLLAQLHLQELAGGGAWDLVYELDRVRELPLGELALQV